MLDEHPTDHQCQLDNSADSALLAESTDAMLWHLRLGHLPFNKLHLINPSIINHVVYDTTCQIFPKAKKTRLSFHASSTVTTSCFKLVHVDIWGPYKTKTHDGYTWFLTIVDGFLRNTWTLLMKNKSNADGILKIISKMVQTQYNTCVECFRTHNAKEFCKGDILDLFHSNGIKH